MNWQILAKKLAAAGFATVGSALGGPAGAAVGARIATALGGIEATPDVIARAMVNDPDAEIALRKLDADFAEAERQHVERVLAAEDVDRNTARQMFKDSRLPAIIACAVVLYFGASLFLPYFIHTAPVDPSHARSLSTLENILLIVIGFYFGSNARSWRKTELIAEKSGKP